MRERDSRRRWREYAQKIREDQRGSSSLLRNALNLEAPGQSGWRIEKKRCVLRCIGQASRPAHNCDFYITGCPYITMYQSKYNRYDKLFAERALVLEMVKNDWSALEHAAAEFCADREIVLLAVKNDWRALKYAAVELCAELQVRRLVILSRALRLRAVNPTVPSSPLVGLLCILPDDCFHRIVHCI